MYGQDTLHKLVEQIERATRGFESDSYGSEHDKVQRYYTGLVVGGTSVAVARERARCAVLYELLYQALPRYIAESQQRLLQACSPSSPATGGEYPGNIVA